MGTVMEKHTHFVPINRLRYVINTLANLLVPKLNSGLAHLTQPGLKVVLEGLVSMELCIYGDCKPLKISY